MSGPLRVPIVLSQQQLQIAPVTPQKKPTVSPRSTKLYRAVAASGSARHVISASVVRDAGFVVEPLDPSIAAQYKGAQHLVRVVVSSVDEGAARIKTFTNGPPSATTIPHHQRRGQQQQRQKGQQKAKKIGIPAPTTWTDAVRPAVPPCAHCCHIEMVVLPNPPYPVVLGMPWFYATGAKVQFGDAESSIVSFGASAKCQGLCGAAAAAAAQVPKRGMQQGSRSSRVQPPETTAGDTATSYPLTPRELGALRQTLAPLFQSGSVIGSAAKTSSPVYFVPRKRNHEPRMCIDYRRLNAVVVRTPLPHLSATDLEGRVKGAKFFSKLCLRRTYHRMRMSPESEWLTAFHTDAGICDWRVTPPDGLATAPAAFHKYVTAHLQPFTSRGGVLVHREHILIYAKTKHANDRLVHDVLEHLGRDQLAINPNQSVFGAQQLEFYGHEIIAVHGGDTVVLLDSAKGQSILGWPEPLCIEDVLLFLDLARPVCREMPNYQTLNTDLLGAQWAKIPLYKTWSPYFDGPDWRLTEKGRRAFLALRQYMSTDGLRFPADPTRQFTVHTAVTDVALACVLTQFGDSIFDMRTIAYHSRPLTPTEREFSSLERHVLAIVDGFRTWQHHLEGTEFPVHVFTAARAADLRAMAVTVGRHAFWMKFMARFHFDILSVKPPTDGGPGSRAAALAKRPDYEASRVLVITATL